MDIESQNSKRHQRLRVYQQWQGNERFFCWGTCVAGPNWRSGLGSMGLLLAPTAVFLALVVPYMSVQVSWAILVISIVFPCFCISMLLLTACSDPGILPRQDPDADWLANRKPRTREVNVNGHPVQVRYNDTCHFYQPPRAHHCSVNDNCIERFDHHCPWVGTTVGLRNYRTFLLFIYGTTLYILWTFGVSAGMLFVKNKELAADHPDWDRGQTWLNTAGQCPAAIVLILFTFIFFWFVGGLSGFHTYLVATNQTTYENFRYNHSQQPNPYNIGLLGNCASVWCIRVPASRVDFRAWADTWRPAPIEVEYNPHWPRRPRRDGPPVASPGEASNFDQALGSSSSSNSNRANGSAVPGGARRAAGPATLYVPQQPGAAAAEGSGPLTANRTRLGMGGSSGVTNGHSAGDAGVPLAAGGLPLNSSSSREDRWTLDGSMRQAEAAAAGGDDRQPLPAAAVEGPVGPLGGGAAAAAAAPRGQAAAGGRPGQAAVRPQDIELQTSGQ